MNSDPGYSFDVRREDDDIPCLARIIGDELGESKSVESEGGGPRRTSSCRAPRVHSRSYWSSGSNERGCHRCSVPLTTVCPASASAGN